MWKHPSQLYLHEMKIMEHTIDTNTKLSSQPMLTLFFHLDKKLKATKNALGTVIKMVPA